MEQDCGGTNGESPGNIGPPPLPQQGEASLASLGGVLASSCGIPKFLTLRIRGTVHGQRTFVLVDSRATHNFIDKQLVDTRDLTTIEFEGFSVLVPVNRTIQCTRYMPSLTVVMGNDSMTNHFFVVDMSTPTW